MTLHDFFAAPLSHEFMQRALLMGLVVAISCAILSCYLVLRGWSLMGDAMSHAVLPGIVLARFAGIPLAIGAFLSGLACALLTGYLHSHTRIREDTVLGVVFSSMLGLGMFLFVALHPGGHLTHILFGNLLGITDINLWQNIIIAGVVAMIILLKWRDYMLYVFDSTYARVTGLPVPLLHYSLLILLTMTAVAAIQAVGVCLVVAMLIAPGITAQMVCRRFSRMLIVAGFSSVLACVSGIYASFHLDASTSACIVLSQAVIFMFACLWRRLVDIHRSTARQSKALLGNTNTLAEKGV